MYPDDCPASPDHVHYPESDDSFSDPDCPASPDHVYDPGSDCFSFSDADISIPDCPASPDPDDSLSGDGFVPDCPASPDDSFSDDSSIPDCPASPDPPAAPQPAPVEGAPPLFFEAAGEGWYLSDERMDRIGFDLFQLTWFLQAYEDRPKLRIHIVFLDQRWVVTSAVTEPVESQPGLYRVTIITRRLPCLLAG